MNKTILMGRLTRDPEIRYTQGDNSMCIARYTLAVDRRFAQRDESGNTPADFIPCVAFGKSGEFVEKYLKKGMKIAVTGRIQTGSYTNKEGVKVYTTEVVVEDQEFAESKKDGNTQQYGGQYGGQPNGQYGGQPNGQYGGQPNGQYGGQPNGQYGGQPNGQYGGQPNGQYGGQPNGQYAMVSTADSPMVSTADSLTDSMVVSPMVSTADSPTDSTVVSPMDSMVVSTADSSRLTRREVRPLREMTALTAS